MASSDTPQFDSSTVGFVGLGNMGGHSVTHLVNKGYNVVVYDIDPEKVKQMVEVGAHAATSVADLASKSTCVVSMVPAPKHAFDVYTGPNGVFENLKNKNSYCLDCSTIGYHPAVQLAKAAEDAEQIFLDTPMSGGSFGAKNASLTFMIGASEGQFKQVKDFFYAIGKNVVHTGLHGTGQLNKVVNNMLLGMNMVGLSEAYSMVKFLNGDLNVVSDVLKTSTGNSACVYAYNPVPGLVPDSPANNDYAQGFGMDLLLKDLGIAKTMAEEAGMKVPMLEMAIQRFKDAKEAGLANYDITAVIKLYGAY